MGQIVLVASQLYIPPCLLFPPSPPPLSTTHDHTWHFINVACRRRTCLFSPRHSCGLKFCLNFVIIFVIAEKLEQPVSLVCILQAKSIYCEKLCDVTKDKFVMWFRHFLCNLPYSDISNVVGAKQFYIVT